MPMRMQVNMTRMRAGRRKPPESRATIVAMPRPRPVYVMTLMTMPAPAQVMASMMQLKPELSKIL